MKQKHFYWIIIMVNKILSHLQKKEEKIRNRKYIN